MADSQGNSFISNPFMQGASKKKAPPAPEPKRQPPLRKTPPDLVEEPEALPKVSKKTPPEAGSKPKSAIKSGKSAKSASKVSKAAAVKSRTKTKKKTPTSSPPPVPSYTGNGYKVQVLAKIPMPTNTNMPSRDYLWFAVYPIIPRVGDCIFHDGRYFRVDAVFLYESTNAGWCADLEVSYYTRRQ
ncbi:hypothetical protein [Leptothoe kymatousa]|uniref:hypothetical protein n=1 Tax=Leptothoe kymatousa TaxID=2651727 RepID=UPI001C20EE4A|nr:hypothetical protein [Leptothoe kymatousa]